MVADATVGPERAFGLEAVFNFRDLGGYPTAGGGSVRWRAVFRADGLHRLTEGEAGFLKSLGIVTVIDLRTVEEVTARGRVPQAMVPGYHHLPLFDVVPDWSVDPDVSSPDFLAERYMEMLDSGREALAATLTLLSDPASLPAVFHCTAGKDRTGIVAAVLLELLGVDRDVVIADYALSQEAMTRMEAWLSETRPDYATQRAARPPVVIEARPETMARFLASVDERFGSVRALVDGLGVAAGVVEDLRRNLLLR